MTDTESGTRRAQRRVKARERGAAMVETAMVFPMFVILWFVTMWVYRTYDTKLDLMARTRGEAWGYAMSNCGKSGTSNIVTRWNNGKGEARTVPAGAPPPITQLALDATSVMFPVFALVAATVNTPIDAARSDRSKVVAQSVPNLWERTDGKVARTATAKVVVFCNETPEDGDLVGVVRSLVHMVPISSFFPL